MLFFDNATIGQLIIVRYAKSPTDIQEYIGTIVEIHSNRVTMDVEHGFRSFSFSKIVSVQAE